MPACGRVRVLWIQQRQPGLAGAQVGVERPRPFRRPAGFDQCPIGAACFLDVEDTLLLGTVRRGLKHEIDGESRVAGQWIGVDEQTVGGTIEGHRRTDIGDHDPRRPRHGHRVPADPIQVVHSPDDRVADRSGLAGDGGHPQRQRDDGQRAAK